MKYKLVVFDLAGTTVKDNNDVHRVLVSALRKHGVQISIDDANLVMGLPKPIAIKELLEKRSELTREISEEWIDEIHKLFVSEMIYFYESDVSVGEKNGVTETFRKLKERGIKIAVDTGFDRLIATSLLKRMDWDAFIDCSVTSDEVPRGRPFPDMIFEAMRKTGVTDVASVVKVGDTASDIQEGSAAGCGLVVAITTGAYSADLLSLEKPNIMIENIPDLIQFLN